MMDRQIDSPIPTPLDSVVWKASKTCSRVPDQCLARITHRDQYATSLAPLGAEQQLAHALVDRAHRFHRVQDQVQHHLLHLNTIAVDSRQALGEAGLHRDPILDDCFAPSNRLADRLVEIETITEATF